MISSLLKKVFGSRNDRLLKQYRRVVTQVNDLESSISALTDEQLKAKTQEFRDRYQAGSTLDDLLPEAFAVVREAGKRVMGMRHFDVQLLGGMILNSGRIAEMRTGEGKTLVATLPAYLNAITGNGVHVVTVNDYLASRDATWMGRLYNFLDMSVGIITAQQSHDEKRAAYAADITYGTNNEFGFDYLRDNMVMRKRDRVQRQLNFAIIDEVDSILIDEARTPLIISGQVDDNIDIYVRMNLVAPLLTRMAHEPKPHEPEPDGDFWVDEKGHQIHLSEAGQIRAEETLKNMDLLGENESLYDPKNITLVHHLMASLRAHHLFFKEKQYVVRDDAVVIVDEFTGRFMDGRRWSDGLHQAVEAKEGVKIQPESQTMASITFQNYFRMYSKLSGMTGTADTEAFEFQDIYNLETVVMPTNKPAVRIDQNDQIYKTHHEKLTAVVKDIRDCHERGQPILVGTTSIESSEELSLLLHRAGLKHEVLNAKQHAREAEIVAEAGMPGRITIATNMAGRGTDIVLGGSLEKRIALIHDNPNLNESEKQAKITEIENTWSALNAQVKEAGGLRVIGTERHDSRRIDNQLRGRSGRQGDPGSSRFYLSLDDQLMKLFAGDRLRSIMERLKLPEGEAIEASMVTRSIESAQRKVEARNFDIRKQLLEYDDVANDQRKVLYLRRNEVIERDDLKDVMLQFIENVLTDLVIKYVPIDSMSEQWDLVGLENVLKSDWHLDVDLQALLADDDIEADAILQQVISIAYQNYETKRNLVGDMQWTEFERFHILQTMDTAWREHLAMLEQLRQGIHLRGYAQKNPKQEYKREAFELFVAMQDKSESDVVKILMEVRIQMPDAVQEVDTDTHISHLEFQHNEAPSPQEPESMVRVGRNDPCPCGSGKKFKQCHGVLS